MLTIKNAFYAHPNKDLLFEGIHWTVNRGDQLALIGRNGLGKSTLLQIVAQQLNCSSGEVQIQQLPYYIPQVFGQFNQLTIAAALQIEQKLQALVEILEGKVSEYNLNILDDDWGIEERSRKALEHWCLGDLNLMQKMGTLSGGQKTRVFLAGLLIHQPEFILLDEPSNHLDLNGRQLLYDFVNSTAKTLVVVSHDRVLLNLLPQICELTKSGIRTYGGNYDFYMQQKEIETLALNADVQSKEKALKKAKDKERDTAERQQKLDSRGKKKQEKSGVSRIMLNTLRNKAENTTSKLKGVHADITRDLTCDLRELRSALPEDEAMRFKFDDSSSHQGKVLFKAADINFYYHLNPLWKDNLNFQINSGERWAIEGSNGSGKTSLLRMVLGELTPQMGTVHRSAFKSVYIDQDYTLINPSLTVYEQAEFFNESQLEEHDVKMHLSRFLFVEEYWSKSSAVLSGGEKMRLLICCLSLAKRAADVLILDEPTNNLDLQNLQILTRAVQAYRGTLVVISHDLQFLEDIHIDHFLKL